MKKIAVLLHTLNLEYALHMLNGISQYYADKDVKLIVFPVRIPHSAEGLFDYQYWNCIPLAFCDQIDGVIVLTGTFLSSITKEDLAKNIKQLPPKPIISVGVKLDIPNSHYIHIEVKNTYSDIVKHLVKEHGCKKIGFFSANLTQSEEALERFEAYKAALADNRLPYDENLVLNGFFTRASAMETIKKTYKSKRDIPFDAIICANDLMAEGCLLAFQKLGADIPKDIKIIGFDNTSHSIRANPKISTIDQQIFLQGQTAAETMLLWLEGKEFDEEIKISAIPIYRQSCGCIPLKNHENVYKSNSNKVIHATDKESQDQVLSSTYQDFLSGINDVYTLFDLTRADYTLRRFFHQLPNYMETAKISAAAIYTFENPFIITREENFWMPDRLNVTMFIDLMQNIQTFETQLTINPYKELIYNSYLNEDIPGVYLVEPVFSGNTNYGFLVSRLENTHFELYSIFNKIIVNALTQSIEYTSTIYENKKLSEENLLLHQDNSDLNLKSQTDELTKILNRRGFLELGQKAIDIAVEMNNSGLIFFIDMDGLKKINDTYGHKMGDAAIKAMANALSLTLRANDTIARIGGDEFAAIATGMTHDQAEKFHQKIDDICEEISKENKFPFTISCSIGTTEFNSTHTSLKELLTIADERQYVEKNQKHTQNK